MAKIALDAGLGDGDWLQAVADHFEQGDVALAATALCLTWSAVRQGNPPDLVTALLSTHESPPDPRCELSGRGRQNLAAFESLVREGFVVRIADGWLLRTP